MITQQTNDGFVQRVRIGQGAIEIYRDDRLMIVRADQFLGNCRVRILDWRSSRGGRHQAPARHVCPQLPLLVLLERSGEIGSMCDNRIAEDSYTWSQTEVCVVAQKLHIVK